MIPYNKIKINLVHNKSFIHEIIIFNNKFIKIYIYIKNK